jgi:alpha-L-arabinofuranosidase
MAEVVRRYSRAPYNVLYWEIGNEPDAYIFPNDSVYGCWGVKDDPYYGGEAYGRMLTAVAAAMKAVNPNVKILNGGLLLDKAYSSADPATRSGRFFEGVLRAGAGPAIDILSFHSYDY